MCNRQPWTLGNLPTETGGPGGNGDGWWSEEAKIRRTVGPGRDRNRFVRKNILLLTWLRGL